VARGRTNQPSAAMSIHPGYLKPGMIVLDLTAAARPTPLLEEAVKRGCGFVSARQMLFDQIALQARLLVGKDVPAEVLTKALPGYLEE
jgi:shikimate 5-dehydrogenase